MMKVGYIENELACLWCASRSLILVPFDKKHYEITGQANYYIPTGNTSKSRYFLDPILDDEGNVKGFECPTCKRKIYLVDSLVHFYINKENKK